METRRAVSRERVIGISFVDILIQAVFVLFIVLVIGYIDPIEREQIQAYHQAGMDLCQKLNKDSPKACREYVGDQRIQIEPPASVDDPYVGLGEHTCTILDISDPDECRKAIDKRLGGSLRPCLRTASLVRPPASTEWDVRSPSEIRFVRFTPSYERYLQSNQDDDRLRMVNQLKAAGKRIYAPENIEGAFGFIREQGCFHEQNITWSCACTAGQLAVAIGAIRQLRTLAAPDGSRAAGGAAH